MAEIIANNKIFFTSGEVAKLLGCSSSWVNVLIAQKQLKTHRLGNKGWHRITRASLENYAQQHSFAIDWSLLN